ncbi:MAG: DUF192 domain-containing protein [Actinomycetota bacterium]
MRRLRLMAAAVLLSACAPSTPESTRTSSPPATGPSSISTQKGLPSADLQILDRSGRTILEAKVEIAENPQSRRIGLMEVAELPQNAGMAFLWETHHRGAFHMLNTLIPLDIAFWDGDMRIVAVLQMQPCETEPPCPTYGPEQDYVGAVELNQGTLDEAGVKPGDKVKLRR